MCPHTTIYPASSYYYICVLIPVETPTRHGATTLQQAPSSYCMCPHTIYTLLYMCLHTTIYVSSYRRRHPLRQPQSVSSYYCIYSTICVLILLHVCPRSGAGTLFESRKADKQYLALCYGHVQKEGPSRIPIARTHVCVCVCVRARTSTERSAAATDTFKEDTFKEGVCIIRSKTRRRTTTKECINLPRALCWCARNNNKRMHKPTESTLLVRILKEEKKEKGDLTRWPKSAPKETN